MLTTLVIKDFAIISELELSFSSGMTVLSGETGAGKSIIINALKLLLGGRSTSDIVRTGSKEAVVEGLFTLDPGQSAVRTYLESLGVSLEDDEFVIRRTVPRIGRGRIYIGGTLQSVTTLRALMRSVMDISGQHEHVSLLDTGRHLAIVDRFAGLEGEVSRFGEVYHRYAGLKKERDELVAQVEDRVRRLDFLNFEIDELESADVRPGESDEVSRELKRLDHAAQWRQTVDHAVDGLYDSERSVTSQLGSIVRELRAFSSFDRDVARICESLTEAKSLVEDAAHDLRSGDEIEDSPERLETLQNRLAVIDKLERKYHVKADELQKYVESLQRERASLIVSDARTSELDRELDRLRDQLMKMSDQLGQKRLEAGKRLEAEATARLKLLAMEHAKVYVQCEHSSAFESMKSTGADNVELLLQPNPGEDPKPLAKIASGGELSRVLLALKRVLVEKDDVATYVFDEVDTGIGGATATNVAEMLREVSAHHQVFCITHLASIACYADSQFLVSKSVVDSRTESHITCLDETARVQEIARMLGGSAITQKTMEHAAEMISSARHSMVAS